LLITSWSRVGPKRRCPGPTRDHQCRAVARGSHPVRSVTDRVNVRGHRTSVV
jgi:hypothetical protein